MKTDSALASPTFLQALTPVERKHLLEQLAGQPHVRCNAPAGNAAPKMLASKQKGRLRGPSIASHTSDELGLPDGHSLVQQLFQYKAALRALQDQADGLMRDNRALSTEVVHLRKVAASERDTASALDSRVNQLQALYIDSFDQQNSLHLQQRESLNAKLDQLATPEVLAATQPPAEFPVPAPHSEPRSLGSAVSEINKLRKQLIHAHTLLAKATKECEGYQEKLSESQSKRKAEKAGYQREMAGMQSRLLGAMRRLVYVADKVAVKDATIAERDAYVNRLEQQLVTKPMPQQQAPAKARTDAVKASRRQQDRRCRSHGPGFRPPSPSPGARAMHGQLTRASLHKKERHFANRTAAVDRMGALRRPATAQPSHSGSPGYRQKHELQSKARPIGHAQPWPSGNFPEQRSVQAAQRTPFGRLDARMLEAATPATPSVIAAGGSDVLQSGHPSAGSSLDEERAWDEYQDALDAMQKRIDAMGPILDAYDAPDVDSSQTPLDTHYSILDYDKQDNVRRKR